MNKFLIALVLSISSSTVLANDRPTYNCSNTRELDTEIEILTDIYEDSKDNSVVQNAVRNELRFHLVMREDLKIMCNSVYDYYNRKRPVIKTIITIEEWYQIED